MVAAQYCMRGATPTDAPRLLAIRKAAILHLAPDQPSMAEARLWACARNVASIRELGETQNVCGALIAQHPSGGSPYVDPAAAGRGVGSALLTEADERLAQQGHREVVLDASPNGLAFYTRRAYRRVGHPRAANAQAVGSMITVFLA